MTRTRTISLLFLCAVASPAFAETSSVQTAWRLLDYIAVDYQGAVADGKVISTSEYAEMVEFAAASKKRIAALAPTEGKKNLIRQSAALQKAINGKASPEEISRQARQLAADLLKNYPVPLAPLIPPNFMRGETLYKQHCASCHGGTGNGKGELANGMEPPPINFTDQSRARERSIFALHQVIEQGIDGTSMPSFAHLSPADRWALALFAGSFAYPKKDAAEGKKVWDNDSELRAHTNLETLVGKTPKDLAAELGEEKATAVTAYLRRNPAAVVGEPSGSPLSLTRTRLKEALEAYQAGKAKEANDLALSAYLDGFEPVEPVLASRNKELMVRIEVAMGALRESIAKSAPVESVKAKLEELDALFLEAEKVLSSKESSSWSSFIGAFTILLREGMEAILIIVAMLAFLRKAERQDMVTYVHGGWIAALVGGAATWAAARWFINISGASRELTEGFGSLFAAVVLVWVGIWMHGKSNAVAWSRYIRDKLTHVLNRKSAWFLFGLSFIVAYREVFETILFYAAIWEQGNGTSVLTGAGAAILVLAVVASAMMRYSRTLPIGKFFAYSSMLIAVLAVVLIGKSVSALQEAGYLSVHLRQGYPRIEALGMYPTTEGMLSQLAVAVILIVGFAYNARR